MRKLPPVTGLSIVLAVALLTVSCTKIDYVGRSYAPTSDVDIYLSFDDIKGSYEVMGLLTASAGAFVSTEKMQEKIKNAEIVDFAFGTYTMPLTRRKYAVGIAAVNVPRERKNLEKLSIEERRAILRKALELFDWNPKALNISEIARLFNVSRDSIYNDIEQILKEKG